MKNHGPEDSLLRSVLFPKMLSCVETNTIKLETSDPQGTEFNIQ